MFAAVGSIHLALARTSLDVDGTLNFWRGLVDFFKKYILKLVDQAEKNELKLGSLVKLVKFQTFSYFLAASRTEG